MKKALCFILFILSAVSVFGQDIITLKDGTDIKAKVIEISSDAIRYKKFDNLEGPTIVISSSNVIMITYPNGTRDMITSMAIEDKTIYANNPSDVVDDMPYRKYKKLYDTEDYYKLSNPRYSPSRCFLNFIFPGVAQYSMHEGGLGSSFLVPSVLCIGAMTIGTVLIKQNREYNGGHNNETLAGYCLIGGACAGLLVTEIVSIINATKVAKYKSLYLNDLDALGKQLSVKFDVNPIICPVYSGNQYSFAVGAGLKMTF